MNLSRVLLVSSALALTLTAAAADEQKTEYGRKSELRGAKVVFIDTGTNLQFRDNAIAVLQRELPEVTISDHLDKSVDVILQFNIDSRGDHKGSATMLVLARPTAPDSVRIVANYEDSKSSIWTFKLSTVLTRRFIRDYLEMNPRKSH